MHNFAEGLFFTQLGEALALVLRAREKHSAWLLRDQGLTDQQLAVLRLIREGSSPCIRQLAGMLYVAPATISGVLDRLLVRGLISEHPVMDDKRKRAFSLTSSGSEALSQNAPLFSPTFSQRLRELDEWEVRMVAAGLRRLADLMGQRDQAVHA
jgi:DNA-binding MarR family transcriptional regulator